MVRVGRDALPRPRATSRRRRGDADAPPTTFRLDLEYDGAEFLGWQRQARGRTVQGVVEEALSTLFSERVAVAGAGRTDAGVHATSMTASFATAAPARADDLVRALDALLPEDVGVLAVTEAAPGFHARRDARWKWYRYTVLRSRTRRVAWRTTSWRIGSALDVDALVAGAEVLRGRRDFASFQNAGSPRASTVRTLAGLSWSEEGPLLHLDAVADGFLYGMMRALAGTLVDVGRGRRTAASLAALVDARDRTLAGRAAPAHGLALVRVGYPGDEPPAFVDRGLAAGLESGRRAKSCAARHEEPDACGS